MSVKLPGITVLRVFSPCRRFFCSLPSRLTPLPASRISITTKVSSSSSKKSNEGTSQNQTTSPHSPHLPTLTPLQKGQISLYIRALLEWNQRMNLTAVTEESEVMTRHVEDSLAIIPPIWSSYSSRCGGVSSLDDLNVIDVGTGAGLPGLIFAIAFPSWKLTLLESMHKRCLFLEHAIGLVGLSNVQVLHARAETVGQSLDFRETFDVAVARAVAELRILAEYCLPLVRVGGLFVAAKGYDPQEEVKNAKHAIRSMGASIIEVCSVDSHGPHGQRTAVICLKDSATPSKYPRQPGMPSKVPL